MKSLVLLKYFLTFFFSLGAARLVSKPLVSYEGFKVLRVDVPNKGSFEALLATPDIQFWNEGHVGGHADVMVSQTHLKKAEIQFILKNLKYSVMIENVQDLIRLEKVQIQITASYNFSLMPLIKLFCVLHLHKALLKCSA